MITYTCDSCTAPIAGSVRLSANDGGEKHFCSPICLSVWWNGQGHGEPRKPIEPRMPQPPVRATLPPPQPRSRRARPLTAEQDAEILRRYNNGEPVSHLSLAYGVAQPTIYKALTRAKAAAPQAHEAAREVRGEADTVAQVVDLTKQVVAQAVDAAIAATEQPEEPAPAPKPTPQPAQPKPAAQRRKSAPAVTARCRDCPRTWNLTGRVLKMTIDLHEHQRGHVVDIEDGAIDA